MKAWKGIALVVCLALAASLAMAGDMKAMDTTTKGKTHKENAEIVSIDIENKTMVIKDEKGEEHKGIPVMGKAVESLKMWKAGDKVTLVCQDNEKGEHQGVVGIMKAGTEPAAKK